MSQHDLQSNRGAGRAMPLLLVLLTWAAIVGLSVASYGPVEPRPASIAEDQFSADRADNLLKQLVGDSIPHPAGSPQNELVRTRIVTMLESFGYAVQIQSGTGTVAKKARDRSPDRDQVDIHNIIAIRKSDRDESWPLKKPIMLVSHYDSVPFGPGASDDGVATAAVLEIARMISTEPPPSRDIVFLITDGEEFGLLGAKMFVDKHRLAKEVGIAINLEARGTTGPSCMFETSRMSRLLIPVFARACDKKFASSLFVEIYKRMPRDTDFSVFKRNGILGYNFAFIGNVKNYHTSADNYENVDQRSLQHHGENAIGLLRELIDSREIDALDDAGPGAGDEAVYFDLFGSWIIWWPGGWSVWLSTLSLVLFVASARQLARVPPRELTTGKPPGFLSSVTAHIGIQVLTIVSVFGVGYLIQAGVRLDPRLSNPWPSHPVPLLLGFWLTSLAVVGAIAMAFSKWTRPRYYLISFFIGGLILAFLTSVYVPGASHLFLVPILVTSAFGLATCCFGQRGVEATMIVAALIVGMMWIPLERIFYDAVGFRMPIVMMARIAVVSTTILGVLSFANERSKFWFTMLASGLAIGAFVAAIVFAG